MSNEKTNQDNSPADAILNPLNELITEKESEILDLKNSFLDDDAIADNVILSKPIADDVNSNQFQLLYIDNEMYYLIHIPEHSEVAVVNKYDAYEIPSNLKPDKTLFGIIKSDINRIINPNMDIPSTESEIEKIVADMIASLNEFITSNNKEQLKQTLKDADDIVKDIINEYSIKISEKYVSKIESKIFKTLDADREPSPKLLANYLNHNGNFFLEYTTRKRYMKTGKGFKEITDKDISAFFNESFGYNEISEKKSREVLGFITREIETNYDLIQFENGILNTDDEIFHENVFDDNVLPKLVVPFKYTLNAKSEFEKTDLYNENKKILQSNRWEWNEDLFYKCVGSCGMAINEIDKLIVIVGDPNSRKSTLLTILKRIFKYSEVKLQTIAENPRFQLLPTIAKDINIDDDMQNFRIEKIGFLNTFVSGNGGEVEIKGANIGAKLTGETTPTIVGASNTLPSITGDGFERRLILILAENYFSESESKKSYMKDILSGKRDDEIGLMFSYSLQQYFEIRDNSIINEEQKKAMIDEWEWKSYPAKKGAEIMFVDEHGLFEKLDELIDSGKVVSYESVSKWQIKVELYKEINTKETEIKVINTFVPVKIVNQKFKEFYEIAYERKKIFKENKKLSTRVIKSAMENAGFYQTNRRYKINETDYENEKVYDDCIDIDSAIGFDDWKTMF